jgi:hypothetical protein
MDTPPDLLSVGIPQILAGLTFPAPRWQVIAQAQYYGAGSDFMLALDRLPTRTYVSASDVVGELSSPPAPPPLPRRTVAPERHGAAAGMARRSGGLVAVGAGRQPRARRLAPRLTVPVPAGR